MNLKERLIEQLDCEIETRQESIAVFRQITKILLKFDGLDVEVPSIGSIWANEKTIHINCYTPGLAQEIANILSIELGITMEKSFNQDWGQHVYKGWYTEEDENKIYFRIDGTPPETCQLRKIEKTVTINQNVYEVVCD